MSDQNEQPLNGQQVAALQAKFQIALRDAIKDVDLRKLALEKAVEMSVSVAVGQTQQDFLELAEAIHAFLAAPLTAPPPA